MNSKLRLLTNIVDLVNDRPDRLRLVVLQKQGVYAGIRGCISYFWTMRHQDVLLFAMPSLATLIGAVLARSLPRGPRRLLLYDILLHTVGDSVRERAKFAVRRWAIRRADRIYTVQRDIAGYARTLGLSEDRFRWVGFKCNNFERLGSRLDMPVPSGGDYVLACGQSYRDYGTFVETMREVGLPARILLPPLHIAAHHGAILPTSDLPSNVEVIHHDMRTESWDEAMLGARMVVIPLRGDCLQPAGISVYLEAMAFGKPVVITEGTSTRSMLSPSEAVVVPPTDRDRLAWAIRSLWHSEELRIRLGESGRRYALRLGGVNRMSHTLLELVVEECEARCRQPRVKVRP